MIFDVRYCFYHGFLVPVIMVSNAHSTCMLADGCREALEDSLAVCFVPYVMALELICGADCQSKSKCGVGPRPVRRAHRGLVSPGSPKRKPIKRETSQTAGAGAGRICWSCRGPIDGH